MMMAHVLWFEQIRLDDLPKVGGKNGSLGEMYQALTSKGVKLPNGFAVSADAYLHFIDCSDLRPRMLDLLARVDAGCNLQTLQQIGEGLRELLLSARLPDDLSITITSTYAMCDIHSNVILAEQLADIFDGFSIESIDLTQLALGLDLDPEIVAPIFDECNAAVKALISQVIHVARQKERIIGICGQATSDYSEFAEFLVKEGIDGIALNPGSVIKTMMHLEHQG